MGPNASMAHCLGTQIQQTCTLSCLAGWGYRLCSADRQSCWLVSLLICHFKWG